MQVLLIKTSSLGDVIHAFPALTEAKRALPNIHIDWVVEEDFAAAPAWHGAVRRVIPISLRRWRKNWWQALRNKELGCFLHDLRATKYDYILDAQGLYKSAAITCLAHGVRCGYAYRAAREHGASFLYQRKFNIAINQHAITRMRQLFAAALGYAVTDNELLDYGIKDKIIATSNARNVYEHKNYLVFVHGTSRAEKCWHEDKWVALTKLAAANNFTVLLPWGNAPEKARAEYIALSANKANVQVLPALSLDAIAALLARAQGVVAVDTGLAHLASALDVPTIALYGTTAPALIGVRGAHVKHIADMANVEASNLWESVRQFIDEQI